MKEEQLKVLRVMSEATGRMDFNEFASMVGLTPSETMGALRELAKTGHARTVGGGYGLTEKGKAILKAEARVPEGTEFNFFTEIGQPTGFSAASPRDFYEIAKKVDASSLEFHLHRGDFKNWVQAVLKDEILANELENVKQSEVKGEDLRERIASAIESHYGAEALR